MLSRTALAMAAAAAATSAALDLPLSSGAAATHYGNPFDGPCQSDEKNLTFGDNHAACGAKCGIGKPCPKDVPAGMTAKPDCFHNEGLATYCVTMCSSASDCGTGPVHCNSNGECEYTGPSGKHPSPSPSPSHHPAPSKQTHYSDPYDNACLSDEKNVSVTGLAGAFCSPACSGSSCPSDVPAGVTAKGQCVLETQGSSKPTQCALVCSKTLPIPDQNAADAQCGAKASCKPISTSAICTYDDGAPPPPAPAPAPSPPPPAPGPSACPTCTFVKLTITPPPAVMIGVGTSSATSAYAAAGYSTGGSVILKTSDGGSTFDKIQTSNGTLLLLGTASLDKDKAFAAGLLSGEYTVDGGVGGM
jgi:hypothetical protein